MVWWPRLLRSAKRSLENIWEHRPFVVHNVTDPTSMEALTCREGLSLAEDLNLASVHMASDYQVVIKDIDQGTSAPYGAIIQEVIARKLSMTSCHLMYESRNCNFEAHHLAKHASSLDVCRHIWLGMPYDPVNISVNIISEI